MADPFLSEIRIFPFNFAPRDWALCAGQLMAIQQNTALFSLIGTYYGGNGTSTFGLPNLTGNVPVMAGTAPAGTYDLGETGGQTTVTLNSSQLPMHTHGAMCSTAQGTTNAATGMQLAQAEKGTARQSTFVDTFSTVAPNGLMDPRSLGPAGGGGAHNNMMPYLTLAFCICLAGVFPQRQ